MQHRVPRELSPSGAGRELSSRAARTTSAKKRVMRGNCTFAKPPTNRHMSRASDVGSNDPADGLIYGDGQRMRHSREVRDRGLPRRPKDHSKGGGRLSPASGAWNTSWCADVRPCGLFVRHRCDPSVVATAASLAQQVKRVSQVENTIVVSQ
jgi:hypothetical protein